jgi:hypothetical protein
MAFVNHFYNATTRKYIALFGTLFNKISISREDNSGNEVQFQTVPISYGPWQKFLSRIVQDPNLTQKSAITLPRMSFEITNMTYDGARKIASNQKIRKSLKPESDDARSFSWSATPYNIDFSLYIMTKYSEDAVKIIEQILPFFKPEWTTTVNLIEDLESFDVPLIMNGITNEELYEGDYETRRSVLWTINFTMKCWYFGPERKKRVIKFTDSHMFSDTSNDSIVQEKVQVYPGLTEDGIPTTDASETIPYDEIEFDSDWGIIREIITEVNDE